MSREKKLVSQMTKKAGRNRAPLPRTAGLRTLNELTSEMTKAGLNPGRIQERANNLAKVAGEKRKRQREEEDAEMDVDEEAGEGDWMDVDDEEGTSPNKRGKANTGAVIAKGSREPKSNRQLAGLRDEAVRLPRLLFVPGDGRADCAYVLSLSYSKRPRPLSCGTSVRGNGICTPGLVSLIVRSRLKWYVAFLPHLPSLCQVCLRWIFLIAQASLCWKAKDGQDGPEMSSFCIIRFFLGIPLYTCCHFFFYSFHLFI